MKTKRKTFTDRLELALRDNRTLEFLMEFEQTRKDFAGTFAQR